MDIGFEIKKLRESKKMTQIELAIELGISQSTLYRIESKKGYKIDIKTINKVCAVFGKEIS